MLMPSIFSTALCALTLAFPVFAATGGSFVEAVSDTKVSAMMMFLGNDEKVYILDKAEGNPAKVADGSHPAWGAVLDLKTNAVEVMDIRTNTFCAAGMHLPNGSYATFGGNGAVGPNGDKGSVPNEGNFTGFFDDTYKDFDGLKSIRVLNPCKSTDNFGSPTCQWYDDPSVLSMQKARWYAGAEPLADGSIVLIGGFQAGGYINRNVPNEHPETDGAEPTYEFYPANGRQAKVMDFMITTSGLNSYPHTYLMPSGKMFVQANLSTILWNYDTNEQTPLPDMPKGVVRVYPASGAVAMLPLTPENSYNPTILFCGGSDMAPAEWGDYGFPYKETWNYPASKDCQRITPEPTDGSQVAYEQDDDLLESRTMGQFVILPDGKLLVVNGAVNGTAGYSDKICDITCTTKDNLKTTPNPYGRSLANGFVGTPAIYDPKAPKGSRWSNKGLGISNIPRLYHSTAILLPDASVLIAGSNPNVDVKFKPEVPFPTEYRAEYYYPPYFSAKVRPEPSGVPSTLSYGGASFDITIPASSYSGPSNTAASGAIVSVVRTGWTTHAMNLGQRYLQLQHTYTVKSDGSIVLHVAQMHPNPNVYQPGPAFLYVVINGVPSVGKYVIVGSGNMEKQTVAAASSLPSSVGSDAAKGTADGASTTTEPKSDGKNNGASSPSMAVASLLLSLLVYAASTFLASI